MRCRLVVCVLAFTLVYIGCVSDNKLIDFQRLQGSLLAVEKTINQDYTRYRNCEDKLVRNHRFDFDTQSFSVDKCVERILAVYQIIPPTSDNIAPILFDLNVIRSEELV